MQILKIEEEHKETPEIQEKIIEEKALREAPQTSKPKIVKESKPTKN